MLKALADPLPECSCILNTLEGNTVLLNSLRQTFQCIRALSRHLTVAILHPASHLVSRPFNYTLIRTSTQLSNCRSQVI